jgi:hypothetical protein
MGRQAKGCSDLTYANLFKAWHRRFGKRAICLRYLKQQVGLRPKSSLNIAIRAFDPHNGISFNRLVSCLQRTDSRIDGGYQLTIHREGNRPDTYQVSKAADVKTTEMPVQFSAEVEVNRRVKVKIDYRKWDVRWSCGEFVVRKRGRGAIAFVARSEWALDLGLKNSESKKMGWGETLGG